MRAVYSNVTLILLGLIILSSCSSEKHISWPQFKPKSDPTVYVNLLAINDFHGQITFGTQTAKGTAGSAPVLEAYLKSAAFKDKNTFIIEAGDLIGASTVASALMHDEPAIHFFNQLKNDGCGCGDAKFNPDCNLIGIPGNHEFDAGLDELLRLLNGGNSPHGLSYFQQWNGAVFPVIAANVRYKETGELVFPPYIIKVVNGVQIAFIGATFQGTPSIVKNPSVDKLLFTNEADAINEFIPELKEKGIRAVVAIIHNGGTQTQYTGKTTQSPDTLSGAITRILDNLDPEVDVAITAHRHTFTNMLYNTARGKQILVTQALSKGMAYADIDLTIDKESGDIIEKSAEIVMTYAKKGPAIQPETVKFSKALAARGSTRANQPLGTATCDILRTPNESGESPLGNLVADALRVIMGADFSFVNLSGIRTNLRAGTITWSRLYYMYPNNNDIVKMTLSGQQIVDLLNQQWSDRGKRPCILQVSGLSYTWNSMAPDSTRIVEIYKDGTPIDRSADYSVVTPSFLADGGENFTLFLQGRDRIAGIKDLDALEAYVLGKKEPFTSPVQNRIVQIKTPPVELQPDTLTTSVMQYQATEKFNAVKMQ